MSQILEVPDDVFEELRHAAEASGLTPVGWIAAHLSEVHGNEQGNGTPSTTLADRFAGRVGHFASGGKESLSETGTESFSDYVESKKKAGHL